MLKGTLRDTITGINECKLSTIAACGDVNRNVMCCPAPIAGDEVRRQMQSLADSLAEHFRPRTTAYYEIWLKDGDETEKVHEYVPVEEPIYGQSYLPRKFKMAVALPEDNCVDVYAHDLGFLAVHENGKLLGYNVLVGGGMGMTPAKKNTFPAVAKRMAFTTPDQAVAVAEAIVKVQRDYGRRDDRAQARLKYVIADWGIEKFKAKVEEYYGRALAEPQPVDVREVDDHLGWHEQGDGKLFLGLNIDSGRIKDEGDLRLKTALRAILGKYKMKCRNTALQGMLLCDINPADRSAIEKTLRDHGVALAEELSLTRRYAIACPAYPTCGLAVTESERAMPSVLEQIEATMAQHGLAKERITVHMTGCPNGCARPFTPDVGLVGKARNKYTVYLGGSPLGQRLGFIFKDMVPQEGIAPLLSPLLGAFKVQRHGSESCGDFCDRLGKEELEGIAG
ncbi:MAG: NADPH-dependent assimilatory sulfite reductase hemoprotein subunit [Planctomycetaceae bacterium]